MKMEIVLLVAAYWVQRPTKTFFKLLEDLEKDLEYAASQDGYHTPVSTWSDDYIMYYLRKVL